MSARQFDNPAVIGPRVESHKNLFFETEVDFNTPFQHQSTPPDTRFVSGNGTSNIKSKARFLVSGSAAQLFDATHPSITVKQMPQCRIPYAQTSITCDASNRSECNKLQTPGIIVLIPCHGDRSRNIRVADLQALGDVNANITMPLPEKDFYLGIAGGKVENDDNQPTRDQPFMRSNITNSLLLNGQIGFHILPAVKFHIDDLVGQHQASVGMQFDSGITIRGQPVSSQAVSACLNGTAEISGKVISELSGKVVAREAIDSISTPLFNTCSQNDLSSPDHSKLVADVNPNLEKIECLSSDFPVPANIPFDQRRSFSQGPQYEVLDLCWYKNDTQGPCPKEQKPLKNPHQFKNVGYTIGNLVWSYVKYQAIGFHGTSRKRFDSIKAEGVRCREAVITADAIENEQFGPGFYTTINREVATIYANKAAENDGSQPIISIVWIPSIQTMKGKVYPWQGLRNDLGAPDPDTPWFGKTKTGGAKYPEADPTFATQLLTDFDYIAGPLKTAVSTVQIKVNPKNCNQITLTESTTDSKWLTPRFFQPDWKNPN